MSSLPRSVNGAGRVDVTDACVVDTDVVSYLFRGDRRASEFYPYVTDATAFVSFMTVAELERWSLQRNWGDARKTRLSIYLNRFSLVLVDRTLCQIWASVSDVARRNGRPIQTADAWIAATAVQLGLPLVTNNRGDFAGVDGLRLLPKSSP